MTLCRHCHRCKINRPRGLCFGCYYRPGVRDLYPSHSKFAPKQHGRKPDTETMADVERIIAEQMANLPAWWHTSNPRLEEYGTEEAGTRKNRATHERPPQEPKCRVRQYPRGRRVSRKSDY